MSLEADACDVQQRWEWPSRQVPIELAARSPFLAEKDGEGAVRRREAEGREKAATALSCGRQIRWSAISVAVQPASASILPGSG